jgi:hypothetical protein
MLDVPGVHLRREVATTLGEAYRGISGIGVRDESFEVLRGEQRLIVIGLRTLQTQVLLFPIVGKERFDPDRSEQPLEVERCVVERTDVRHWRRLNANTPSVN